LTKSPLAELRSAAGSLEAVLKHRHTLNPL